jgi:glycosyltransferase involved in cell wall biosynthesis
VRVVVVSQWFPPESASIPADIARGIAGLGHDVTVLTGFPNYPTGKIYDGWHQRPWLDGELDGFKTRRTALYPSHDSSAIRRAASYLSFGLTSTIFGWSRLRSADVIYVYHPPLTSAIGPWLNRRTGGAPYLVHLQDLWPDSVVSADMIHGGLLSTANGLLSHACAAVYRRASGIICIAPAMASILNRRGVPEHKLHVVPNWADESAFFPASPSPDVARRLGTSGHFTVMFAGNLGHLQGLDVAIRAAATLRDLPDFRLVIVGDGVARASLAELAMSLGAGNVVFVPPEPVAAMNEITHAADVQLVCLRDLPFFRATIPSKLGAVLASGLPVICAVNGDAGQLVSSAGAGWVCAAEDTEALARAFRHSHASSPAELREHGLAGHRYYVGHLARDGAIERMEGLMHAASHD